MLKIDELITSSESVRISKNKKRSAFYESAFLTIDKKEISSRWDNYNLTKYITMAESANVKDGEIFNEEDVDTSKMKDVTGNADSSNESSTNKKENKFKTKVSSLIERSKKWIKTMWEKIKTFFRNLWKRIKKLFKKKSKKNKEDVRMATNSPNDIIRTNLAEEVEYEDGYDIKTLGEEYKESINKASGDIRKLSKILNMEPLAEDKVVKAANIARDSLKKVVSVLDKVKTNGKEKIYGFLTNDNKMIESIETSILVPMENIVSNSTSWSKSPDAVKVMTDLIGILKEITIQYNVMLNMFKVQDAEIVN